MSEGKIPIGKPMHSREGDIEFDKATLAPLPFSNLLCVPIYFINANSPIPLNRVQYLIIQNLVTVTRLHKNACLSDDI